MPLVYDNTDYIAWGNDGSITRAFTTTTTLTTEIGFATGTQTENLVTFETSVVVLPPTCENLYNLFTNSLRPDDADVHPNPDIAGIGTILAFVLTSFSALIVTLVAYYGGFLSGSVLSRSDRRVFFANSRNVNSEWRRILEGVALSLSDQQLVTGLAILIAGFMGLADSGMDFYHWNTIVCLAWMSSSVHITSLSLLRDAFDSNPRLRNLRVAGMLVLLALLSAAFLPLRWTTEIIPYWVPVRCLWGRWFAKGYLGDGSPGISEEWQLTLVMLIGAYVWKLCQLFAPSRSLARKWIRAKPEAAIERLLRRLAKRNDAVWPSLAYKSLTISYMVFIAWSEFVDSFMASVCYFCLSLPWGTVNLLYWRSTVSESVRVAETQMTFGQLVPLFLLALPLLLVFELSSGPVSKREERNELYKLIAEERHRALQTVYPNLSSALLMNEPSQWSDKIYLHSSGVPDPVIDHLMSSKAFKWVVWSVPVMLLGLGASIAAVMSFFPLARVAVLGSGGGIGMALFTPTVAWVAFFFSKRLL